MKFLESIDFKMMKGWAALLYAEEVLAEGKRFRDLSILWLITKLSIPCALPSEQENLV